MIIASPQEPTDILDILTQYADTRIDIMPERIGGDYIVGEGVCGIQRKTEADLIRLREERQAYEAAIPPETMSQYEFIRSRIKDAAVAPVIGGICQLCHMRLPPQQFIELRQLKGLMNCPSCQRIIYWVEYDS